MRSFLGQKRNPVMWKADFSKVYRRVQMSRKHAEMGYSAWVAPDGTRWKAQQYTMAMGATAAVYNWHRIASLFENVIRHGISGVRR